MTIKQYLERNALSARQFALGAGLSPQYVSCVMRRRQGPSMAFATAVHIATNGQVNLLNNIVSDQTDQTLTEGPSGSEPIENPAMAQS
jgi:transcriptional regulator with XRE-family HTH domain